MTQQASIPYEGMYQSINYEGMAVLEIDLEANKEKINELEYQIEKLKKDKEDSEAYYQDNWRPIPTSTYYGIRERDFY